MNRYLIACSRHPRCYLADGHPDQCLAPDGTVLLVRRESPCEALRLAARYVVQLGNQPGFDDDEWEQAVDALAAAVDALESEAGKP